MKLFDLADKIVAIDGKTSRRSFDDGSKPMHLVSAFVSELGITLGQLKTADKSNEITAIPELLELLDIAGSIVTIDAMGCQIKIVEKIVDKKADCLIGLKGNQGTFNEDARLFFENKPKQSVIKKTALNLLQIIKKNGSRISLKAMRKLAGWDNDFLDSVLMANF